MKSNKIRALLLAAGISVLTMGITACGSGQTDGTSAQSATEAATEAQTEAAAESSEETSEAGTADSETSEDETASDTEESGTESSQEQQDQTETDEPSRRYLPEETESSTAASSEQTEDTADVTADTTQKPATNNGGSIAFIVRNNIKDTKVTQKATGFPGTEKELETVLADLVNYWSKNDMSSVDYLLRMDKFVYISGLLDGSNDYFYVGDEDANHIPNGTGLAVYSNNRYYYGGFKDGKRSGQGTWYQIFDHSGEYCKTNNGIYTHMYTGAFENDLPNGEGQEHLDIDNDYVKEMVATNVIGSFKDGYYDGEEHITTIDENKKYAEWTGNALKGAWIPIDKIEKKNSKGNIEVPVAENIEKADNYIWMLKTENSGQGITGLTY